MNKRLFFQAVSKFILGLLLVSLLLFWPAKTFHYWQAWLLICVLFIPMFFAGIILFFKIPGLLEIRLNAKEEQSEQKTVILFSAIMFVAAFLSAGFSRRFHWLLLPSWVSYAASALFLLAYVLFAEVIRENSYLSRTIEIQENQKVIDTGLYGIVRHPMYMSTVLLFLSMPLILGSIISFVIMLLYIPIIAKRIKNEELVLEKGLDGYAEYKQKIKYKVIPFIW